MNRLFFVRQLKSNSAAVIECGVVTLIFFRGGGGGGVGTDVHFNIIYTIL